MFGLVGEFKVMVCVCVRVLWWTGDLSSVLTAFALCMLEIGTSTLHVVFPTGLEIQKDGCLPAQMEHVSVGFGL